MQVAVDVPEEALAALDRLAAADGTTRDALVREAIAGYLAGRRAAARAAAFGLWGRGEDGLAYTRRLREEW